MFMLTTISDLVQVEPAEFGKNDREAIEDCINSKYANKVIPQIGLCICFYDIASASQGLIGHGTGLINVNAVFRVLVFRPFRHEVIVGKISSSSKDGMKIRTDFFDEIWVPAERMPDGSRFSAPDKQWIVESDGDTLYLDNHDSVRVRVESEVWEDTTPTGPGEEDEAGAKSPYIIYGSMLDAGLGPCIWWD